MIKIVMGLPCAGKSTFIKNNFPNIKKIDLYDYQKNAYTREAIWQSYEDTKEEVIKSIKNNEDFVLEHTLLKAARRKYYIDAIREVTQEPIELYLIQTSKEQYLKQREMRNVKGNDDEYDFYMNVFEEPTLDEGFSKINIVNINYNN